MNFAAVALGSALGGLARYGLSLVLAGLPSAWVIFGINVAGSYLIGYFHQSIAAPDWRLLAITGFCGGFTTFSAFAMDTIALWQRSRVQAAAYVVGSVALSIGAAWLGTRSSTLH